MCIEEDDDLDEYRQSNDWVTHVKIIICRYKPELFPDGVVKTFSVDLTSDIEKMTVLPDLDDENKKQNLAKKLKSGFKIKDKIPAPVLAKSFLGMSQEDLIAFRDFFDATGCITNAKR